MRLTKSSAIALACAAFAACPGRAEPSAELLDLAARVQYGFYHGDPRTIDTALTALDRLGDSPEVHYYRDFAALRRAQLGAADRSVAARLAECARREVASGLEKARTGEGWVLVAACALLIDDDRRREEALARARALDDDNPRIALVEYWALERDAAGAEDVLAAKLAIVIEAFAAWTPTIDDPDWGHAEALAALAASMLERGQVRAARDLIEQALLLAPEYRAAVELRATLQSSRTGGRAL